MKLSRKPHTWLERDKRPTGRVVNMGNACRTCDWDYVLDDAGNAAITAWRTEAAQVEVPAWLDGHAVKAIADRVFENRTTLEFVRLPETACHLGTDADVFKI